MGRGPSYPFVGLEEAISLTRQIYDYAKRSVAPSGAVIEQALKYSVKSSSGIKSIAALKSFGLIEDVGGTGGKSIKITDRAYRILIDKDAPESIQALKDAALSPKWYAYCWEKWGSSAPPSMRSTLVINHGFIPTTVDSFLKDYKKTIEYAGIAEKGDYIVGKNQESSEENDNPCKIGSHVQWESQGVLRMPESRKLTHFSPEGDYAFVEGFPTGIPVGELIPGEVPEQKRYEAQNILTPRTPTASGNAVVRGEVKMETETFALPGGITALVRWPSIISKEDYDDFEYSLTGLKRKVIRAVRGDSPVVTDVPPQDESR